MLGLFGNDNTSLIGLDISSSSIKLLELSKSGHQYRVDSFHLQLLEPGIVEEKVIKNKDKLQEAITALVRGAKTDTRNVAVALPDSSVISKVIQVESGLGDREIQNHIEFEADKYIPYPLEEVNLDFSYLGTHPNNPDIADVLIVACRSEAIQQLEEILTQCDLNPSVVDVESYAMERACKLLTKELPELDINEIEAGKEEIITIFDLGASVTNLTVLSNRETIYSREEIFGGEQLITEIQNKYELSREEAIKRLYADQLPDDFEENILEPFKEAIVLHIRRSLQFFFSASHYNEIHKIILAGGNANIPGITGIIEEQLGVQTIIVNPFVDMKLSHRVDKNALKRHASSMMLCCGLAMRTFDK